MKKGLFGGTFDPFHLGHLNALNAFSSWLGEDSKVIVMPTGTPPHKRFDRLISDRDRLELIRLAIGDMKNVELSDYELYKEGKSYTAETLQWLKKGCSDEDTLYLFTGSDMFLSLQNWYHPETIFSLAQIVCFTRTGGDRLALEKQKERLEKDYGAVCHLVNYIPVAMSSHEIRALLSEGSPDARQYLPEKVFEYIRKHSLYLEDINAPVLWKGIDLKRILSDRVDPARYAHSLGVMDTIVRLARRYGFDEEKARLAGLLHDITKNIPFEKQKELIRQYGIPVDDDILRYPKLCHAVTAPYVIRYEIGIEDGDILNAVRYHTTGRAEMSLFEKLLYVADYVDPTRTYEDVDFYRRLAFADIDWACYRCLAYEMTELAQRRGYIYHDTYEAYQWFVRFYEDHPEKIYDEKLLTENKERNGCK